MNDKDLELYLTLKFNNIGDALAAFKKAIGEPKGHLIKNPATEHIARGIRKWVKAGCPDTMEIADEDVELFLIVKFGSLAAAHHHWVNTVPGNPHDLSDKELTVVLDRLPDDPSRD